MIYDVYIKNAAPMSQRVVPCRNLTEAKRVARICIRQEGRDRAVVMTESGEKLIYTNTRTSDTATIFLTEKANYVARNTIQ